MSGLAIKRLEDGIMLDVYVRPYNLTKLCLEGDRLVYHIKEPPVRSRANLSLLRHMTRALGSKDISIVRGSRDRVKTLLIKEDERRILKD